MQTSTNVRVIKQAITLQAKRTRRVSLDDGNIVIDAKRTQGRLQVRLLGVNKWYVVSHVNIV
jgi:hypothetical protein